MNTKKGHQKYTEEFKRDAVKMVVENRYSANKFGLRLGISGPNVSRWVREYQDEKESAFIITKSN